MSRTLVLALTLTALACGESRPSREAAAPIDSVSLARARQAADALGGDLLTMLRGELDRGGPAAAIAVCADSAQVRTLRHSTEGVAVRRVGTRVRNAANAPDAVESAVLDAFAAAVAANRPLPDTVFVTREAGANPLVHYMRAIRVQEFCLACHGPADGMGTEVKQVIAARYPDDRATGYVVGDLRGAISVTVARTP
ncbi:MAG TPA: DUF3365 domain-containing protein [Gemmatimonadaceae bacterium]